MGLSWTVKFLHRIHAWNNVFRFTTGTRNLSVLGDRVIALFLASNNMVHLVIENNNSRNWHINSIRLVKNRTYNFELEVDGLNHYINLKINGATVFTRSNIKGIVAHPKS